MKAAAEGKFPPRFRTCLVKGIADYWWNANARLNVIYSRGSYAINEQKHYYTWNSQESVKSKAHAQDGFTGYLKIIFSQNSRWKFWDSIFNIIHYEVHVWSEYRKAFVSQTAWLWISLPQVGSVRGRALGALPGVAPGSPGHGSGSPRTWALRGRKSASGEREEQNSSWLAGNGFLGEICRFWEHHKTAKWSSKRLRHWRLRSQHFSMVLKLSMDIFCRGLLPLWK